MGIKERVDEKQQGNEKLAIGAATLKKFSEDRSTNLASMVAFWAIFSIFPLFLLLVTLLGYVLSSSTKQSVLTAIGDYFPLLNVQQVSQLSGSWWAIVLGAVTALWSGTAVIRMVQYAFNSVWEIPEKDRPGLGEQLGRSIVALVAIGGGLIIATLVSGFVTGQSTSVDLGFGWRIVGWLVALVLDVGIFLLAFRLLTDRDVSTRDVLPGAILSGVAFFLLQQLSSLIISRYLSNAQDTYGNFATIITILWWFYLQSIITLLGAQLNVVLKERLHPRTLFGPPSTDADRRALEAYAEERTYDEREEVDASVPADGRSEDGEGGERGGRHTGARARSEGRRPGR